jgi:hypothetical protein
MASWEPLEEPLAFTDIFRRWKKAFRLKPPVESNALITSDLGPSTTTATSETQVMSISLPALDTDAQNNRQMTPYESLLWSVWLPRVRSSIKYVFLASPFQIVLNTITRAVIPGPPPNPNLRSPFSTLGATFSRHSSMTMCLISSLYPKSKRPSLNGATRPQRLPSKRSYFPGYRMLACGWKNLWETRSEECVLACAHGRSEMVSRQT